jgi:formylglycine-generating enzyme required for sulfatase activity
MTPNSGRGRAGAWDARRGATLRGMVGILCSGAFAAAGVAALAGVLRQRMDHPYRGPSAVVDGRALTLTLNDPAGSAASAAPLVRLELVRIPAGSFVMGSPDTEADRDASEGPAHPVTISHDFFLGRYEVTQAQWMAVMGANQSRYPDDPRRPAEQVSWGDCQKFCAELTRRTGRTVRLPTEAEWEYAARANTTTPFNVGSTLSSTQANFNGEAPYGDAASGTYLNITTAVGSYKPNGFGLYDTIGNVCEWCQDTFHPSYEGAPTDGSAWMSGAENPDLHVFRGGAYNNDGSNCRSAVRFAGPSDMRAPTLGFRLAADVLDAGANGGNAMIPWAGGPLER